jgi:2-polyprenyl-3-methyl-5-hydroxy-6-metoxy-1,4-benzoquinol methylase
MCKIALFFLKGGGLKGLEGQTAERVYRRLVRGRDGAAVDFYEVDGESPLHIQDVCKYDEYDVFIFICGKVFITQEGVNSLAKIAYDREDLFAIAPVTNLSKLSQQIQTPPFFYQTISVLTWAVREIRELYGDEVVVVDEIDGFCLGIKSQVLEDLPEDTRLIELPDAIRRAGERFGIAKGVYAHCYGDLYESGRDDLLVLVPLDSRDILDIGCANGLFGEMLKKRQTCRVTGVEWDAELSHVARMRLDHVLTGDIEEIIDRGTLGKFDCIVCGDVLEHLNNPWKVVAGLKRHLKEGAVFVASTPNIANWAIVYEMLKGRWDYVPFTILSGTHIRFFTRESLRDCFEDAGYRIREITLQGFEIPPEGAEFIDMLRMNMSGIDVEELKAAEIVVVAEPGNQYLGLTHSATYIRPSPPWDF